MDYKLVASVYIAFACGMCVALNLYYLLMGNSNHPVSKRKKTDFEVMEKKWPEEFAFIEPMLKERDSLQHENELLEEKNQELESKLSQGNSKIAEHRKLVVKTIRQMLILQGRLSSKSVQISELEFNILGSTRARFTFAQLEQGNIEINDLLSWERDLSQTFLNALYHHLYESLPLDEALCQSEKV
ncbi:hypothetical protein [Marasmitruncus massiliensis]|uniref:hypothetical protein n=1 Tax=Marasmitruncus massiliensis TaxID=1944642 RepID=UPI000C7C5525|nr:hypothetical protein [Marasmitruncus massiliensis]